MKNLRGTFPFKLATTSYIYPDRIVPNVRVLAPSFDEIELLLFESSGPEDLPDPGEINALAELTRIHGVGFNVHLPLDIFLGDEKEETRSRAVSVVKDAIGRTLSLNPSVYTLHLELNGKRDLPSWQGRLRQSMESVMECGLDPGRISIETLAYPFEWVEGIVDQFGFSICLDLGHLLAHGQDLETYLRKHLARTSIVHLHGVENGRDHLGIDRLDRRAMDLIFSYLGNYTGVVSIEVFSLNDLNPSLEVLEKRGSY